MKRTASSFTRTFFCILVLSLLFCVGLLLSPLGETVTASLVERVCNAWLVPVGQRVRIGAAGELWRGELVLWNVSVQDTQGEWLFLPYIRLIPASLGLFPHEEEEGEGGLYALRLARVDINNADMFRVPLLLKHTPEDAPRRSLKSWTFAPPKARVDVDSLRLNAVRVGMRGEHTYINAHARLALTHDTARLRMTMDARSRSHVPRLLPAPLDLPEDIAQFPRLPNENEDTTEGYSLLSLDWDRGFIDIRAQARDSLLLRRHFPNIDRVWSRWRVQIYAPLWSPDAKHPVRVRWTVRFGLHTDMLTARLRASSLAGQVFWDGTRIIARDIRLSMPADDPKVVFQGSAGFDPEHGPGVSGVLELSRLHDLTRIVGLGGPAATLDGSLHTHVDIGRGGRHTGWWLTPLPEPAPFIAHPLPGFTTLTSPPSILAEGVLPEGTGGLQASFSPTAMRVRCVVDSPYLRVPGGDIRQMRLSIHGISAATDTLRGLPNALSALSVLPGTLVGAVDIRADALPGLGATTGGTRWALSNIHEPQSMRLHLADIDVKTENARLEGHMTLARVPRELTLWPWADGELRLAVRNLAPIARLWEGSAYGENIDVRMIFTTNEATESTPQERRQSLTMRINAGQYGMANFTARGLSVDAQSHHAHALADVCALTLSGSRSQWAQAPATPDVALFSAAVRSGSGTTGSWSWQQAQGTVHVVGEEARFHVRLAGGSDGVVRGTFQVRERLLQLHQMDVRDTPPKK